MTTPTRAIFIDFDGVMHPSTAIETLDTKLPLLPQVQALDLFRWTYVLADMLHDHPDVMLFVHSSWGHMLDNTAMRQVLGPLAQDGRYFSVTNTGISQREASIADMVDKAQLDSFLILDDAHAEFSALRKHLVVCNPLIGITEPAVKQSVVNWLWSTQGRLTI
jgi:hypothetical protein